VQTYSLFGEEKVATPKYASEYAVQLGMLVVMPQLFTNKTPKLWVSFSESC
jgi:hypothetical protein